MDSRKTVAADTDAARLMDEANAATATLERRQRKTLLYRVQAASLVLTALVTFAIVIVDDDLIKRVLAAVNLIVSACGGLCAIDMVRERHDRLFGGILTSTWILVMVLFVLMLQSFGEITGAG